MRTRNNTSRFETVILPLATSILLAASVFSVAGESDWPQWRGPRDNGTAEAGTYAVKWDDTTNMLWKAPLPGKGCSTPIIWNKNIFVTAPVDGQDAVLALDWSGKPLWQTKLGPERPGKHRNGSGSNPSAVTDGKGIFVYFKSGSFAALDLNGKIRWQTNLVEAYGRENLVWDYGTSPVVTEKHVVMARMHRGESWVAAFDKTTGELRWKIARTYQTPNENDNGYTTPLVIRHRGKESLLVWGGEHLTIHDAVDGKVVWTCRGFNPDSGRNWPAVANPVISGDIVVVPFGRNDRGRPLLFGVRLTGEGDVTSTSHVWKRDDISTFVPSLAENKGRVYLLRDRGEVECLDPATGKTIWNGALPEASANYYSSPVITGGKLYAIREDGAAFVVRAEDKFELIAENKFDDRVIASPVLLDNRIFIRGEKNLYCIGTK